MKVAGKNLTTLGRRGNDVTWRIPLLHSLFSTTAYGISDAIVSLDPQILTRPLTIPCPLNRAEESFKEGRR